MGEVFGEFVKRLRLERGMTLRRFSETVGVDPANYSKIERGVVAPPHNLKRIEAALGLAPDSLESRELKRLAALGRGQLPPRVLADEELLGKLPALFRTLEGDPVDDALLDELVATIRKE